MKRCYRVLIWLTVMLVIAGCGAPAVVEEQGVQEDVQKVTAGQVGEPTLTAAPAQTAELVQTEAPVRTDEPLQTEEPQLPSTPEEVWGELIEAEGGLVWGTLSDARQALVNYPRFDESEVFWTKGGSSYHAIDWCYTLLSSKTIVSGELEEARAKGKQDPCSKCVGH